MARHWLTIASPTTEAITNPLLAACEDGYVPDSIRILSNPTVQDNVSPIVPFLEDLVDDIVETHHEHLRSELPSLERTVRKVTRVHGDTHPELEAIESEFLSLEADVTEHIADEEETVFPEIVTLDDETPRTDTEAARIRDAINHLESEHDAAASHLEGIRDLSDDYTTPSDACTSYRNMLDRLQLHEEDMHVHIHKGNNVLCPDADALLTSA
ncbi:hemerythrin domain-containing protein [Natronorubrum sp. FCH18a]|uniref:hemerythrin domain-containing protein n=1 Tax=Natronorubrum sp. FCH18a TaxID=3447018 RepID=UPI003F51609B